MEEKAYAKINIGLSIGGREKDGLHSLESYMALIDLYDSLDISIEPSSSLSVSIHPDREYLAEGEEDIMERCARIFSERFSLPFHLSIRIRKRIPPRAGLGGGSADAAAVLRALFRHFGISEDIEKTAFLVGSDVPFLASGCSTAFVSGRGECVREEKPLGALPLLLFLSGEGNSTKEAYGRLDLLDRSFRHLPPLSFPSRSTFPNDFELVYPLSTPKWLSSSPAYVSLSGSGSAWYALFPSGCGMDADGAIRTHLLG